MPKAQLYVQLDKGRNQKEVLMTSSKMTCFEFFPSKTSRA